MERQITLIYVLLLCFDNRKAYVLLVTLLFSSGGKHGDAKNGGALAFGR
jgi:hypothetical protein